MEHYKSPVMPLPHLVTNNKGLDPSKNVQYIPVSEMAAKLKPAKVKVIVGSTNFELQEHTAPLNPFYLVSNG